MDRDLAITLAKYAEFAYLGPEGAAAALPEAKLVLIDRDDTQAYLIEAASHTTIAFRGTQVASGFSLADILSNLLVRRLSWNIGKVHRGYSEALRDIAKDIQRIMERSARPLYFTGHSLGGCLATLASTLLQGPTSTYTFGAPRVGNRRFCESLKNVYRIVYADDIAPKYPLPLGYRHGGEAWHLSRDGALKAGRSSWRSLLVPMTRQGLVKGILDHRIGEYVKKLELGKLKPA